RRAARRAAREPPPGRPPVGGGADDPPAAGRLAPRPPAVLVEGGGVRELDADLRGPARVVGRHGSRVAQARARAPLDELPGARRRHVPAAGAADGLLDGDGGEAGAEELRPLPAGGAVAGDEQPRAAE